MFLFGTTENKQIFVNCSLKSLKSYQIAFEKAYLESTSNPFRQPHLSLFPIHLSMCLSGHLFILA